MNLRACPNCLEDLKGGSGHFCPPCFGDPGIWTCVRHPDSKIKEPHLSKECAEGKHSDCKESFETCECKYKQDHTTMHSYFNRRFPEGD